MKTTRILTLVTVFVLLFSVSSAVSEKAYSPALGMTMDDFILKYNAAGSSLNSSLIALRVPNSWHKHGSRFVSGFKPDTKSSVQILLISDDSQGYKTSSGLDEIQIHTTDPADFPALITVTLRCANLFGTDVFSLPTGSFCIADAVSYYYDNGLDGSDYIAYRAIDAEEKYLLRYWHYGPDYYFAVTPNDL